MTVPVNYGGNSYTYFDHQKAFAQTYGMRPEQMADHYRGLLAGMMGLPLVAPSETFRMGYELGASGRVRSEELRIQKVEAGRRSAESRRAKKGSAQPPKSPEQFPNDVPNDVEITSPDEKIPENFAGETPNGAPENSEQRSSDVRSFLELGRKEGRKEREADASLNAPCKSDLSVNTARESSETGGVGQICKKRGWQDLSSRPSLENFLAYAAERWPEWHRDDLVRIYGDLVRRGWTAQAGEPIANWQSLLASFRFHVDPAHLGERYPLGQFVRNLLEGAA